MSASIRISLQPYGLRNSILVIKNVPSDQEAAVRSVAFAALEGLSTSLERTTTTALADKQGLIQEACNQKVRWIAPSAQIAFEQGRLSPEEQEASLENRIDLAERALRIEGELIAAVDPNQKTPAQTHQAWTTALEEVFQRKLPLPAAERDLETALLVDVFRRRAPFPLPADHAFWRVPSLLPPPSSEPRAFQLRKASPEQFRHALLAPSVVWAAARIARGSSPTREDLTRIETTLLCSHKDALRLIALCMKASDLNVPDTVVKRPGDGRSLDAMRKSLDLPEASDPELRHGQDLYARDAEKLQNALTRLHLSFEKTPPESEFLSCRMQALQEHVNRLEQAWSSLNAADVQGEPQVDWLNTIHQLADHVRLTQEHIDHLELTRQHLTQAREALERVDETAQGLQALEQAAAFLKGLAPTALLGADHFRRALLTSARHLEASQKAVASTQPQTETLALWLRVVLGIVSLGIVSLILWAARSISYRREESRLQALVRHDLDQARRLADSLNTALHRWQQVAHENDRRVIEDAAHQLALLREEIRPLAYEVHGSGEGFPMGLLKAQLQADGERPSYDLAGAAGLAFAAVCRDPRGREEELQLAEEFANRHLDSASLPQLNEYFQTLGEIKEHAGTLAEGDKRQADVDRLRQAAIRHLASVPIANQLAWLDDPHRGDWAKELPLARALEGMSNAGRNYLLRVLEQRVDVDPADRIAVASAAQEAQELIAFQRAQQRAFQNGADRQALLETGLGARAPSLLTPVQRTQFFNHVRDYLGSLDTDQPNFAFANRAQEDLWNALQAYERSSVARFEEDYRSASDQAVRLEASSAAFCDVGEALEQTLAQEFAPPTRSLATFLQSLEDHGPLEILDLHGALAIDNDLKQFLKDQARGGFVVADDRQQETYFVDESNTICEYSDPSARAVWGPADAPRDLDTALGASLGAEDPARTQARINRLKSVVHQGSLSIWPAPLQHLLSKAPGWLGASQPATDRAAAAYFIEPKSPGQGVRIRYQQIMDYTDQNGEMPRRLIAQAILDVDPENLDSDQAILHKPFTLTLEQTSSPPQLSTEELDVRQQRRSADQEFSSDSAWPPDASWETVEGLGAVANHRLQDPKLADDLLDHLPPDQTSSQVLQDIQDVLKNFSVEERLQFFENGGLALFKQPGHLQNSQTPQNTPDSLDLARKRWHETVAPALLKDVVTDLNSQAVLATHQSMEAVFDPAVDATNAESVHKWLVRLRTLEEIEKIQPNGVAGNWASKQIWKFMTALQGVPQDQEIPFLKILGKTFLAKQIPFPEGILDSEVYRLAQAMQTPRTAVVNTIQTLLQGERLSDSWRADLDRFAQTEPKRAAAIEQYVGSRPLALQAYPNNSAIDLFSDED